MIWKWGMCLRAIDNVNGVILDLTEFWIFPLRILFCNFSVSAQQLYVLKDRDGIGDGWTIRKLRRIVVRNTSISWLTTTFP